MSSKLKKGGWSQVRNGLSKDIDGKGIGPGWKNFPGPENISFPFDPQ